MIICVGIIGLAYQLIFVFTQSVPTALIGCAIIAATNLTDDAIFVGTNSHIFFCMFFFLLLFYAIYQYAATEQLKWKLIAFLAILLGPSTFALGLTSVVFVPLFWRLCLPPHLQQKSKDLLPLLFIGWLLSLIPYFYAMDAILHAKHYQDVGAATAFQVAHFLAPVRFLGEYVALKLLPSLFANPYLSFGLFFLCVATAIHYTKDIPWQKILFFVLFGLSNNFIIFVFRDKWGTAGLDTARYYVFPVVMVAFSYALILHFFIQTVPRIKQTSTVLLVYLLCAFAVTYGSLYRYKNADLLLKETMVMQNLYVNFRKAFVNYFAMHNIDRPIEVKRGDILMPNVSRLTPKGGYAPAISRYSLQSRQFYAQFVLPSSINKKIVWSNKTNPDFLQYLTTNGYTFLIYGDE